MKYDTIIVGASFAGLATAGKISNGRTLLIDAKPIGTGIKSACGTVLETVLKLGLETCVLQQHKKMVLHTSKSNFTYQLTKPFCVIDGEKFCQRLFEQGQAEFIQSTVSDFDGKILTTSQGNFQADIFVDASGPNSVLAKNRKSKYLSFGLETVVNYQEQGLHFWYEPKILPKGIFWLFPQGKTSRIGVGSYVGETNLLPKLIEFLKRFNLKKGDLHGGFFPYRLKEPIIDKVFMVGDAAGHCFPITGEGIRPAIFFGQKLGEIINLILKNKITHQQGLKLYSDFVLKNRKNKYEVLYWGQKFFTNIPEAWFDFFASLVSKESVMNFVENKYLNILTQPTL